MGIFMGKVICLFFFFASSVVVKFLLGLTDLNWFFFIGISLVILPQIYTNASNNVRPQVLSRYNFYLFSRFLLIVKMSSLRATSGATLTTFICSNPTTFSVSSVCSWSEDSFTCLYFRTNEDLEVWFPPFWLHLMRKDLGRSRLNSNREWTPAGDSL